MFVYHKKILLENMELLNARHSILILAFYAGGYMKRDLDVR